MITWVIINHDDKKFVIKTYDEKLIDHIKNGHSFEAKVNYSLDSKFYLDDKSIKLCIMKK
jgi:hypothetical protein